MKRSLPPILAVVALAGLSHAAFASVGAPAPAGARLADEPWVVLNVSPSGRTLLVEAFGGGCGRDPRATVTETSSTVAIRVQQVVPAGHGVCPAIARVDRLRVRLSEPLAGRRLTGQSLRGTAGPHLGRRRMPRVLGMRAADARFALRAQGFRVRDAVSGMVGAQRPRPRALVDERRLDAVLEAALRSGGC